MLYHIYCIWVKTEDGVLRYYGHTKNMTVRKGKHVGDHKRWVAAGKPEKTGEAGATRSVYVIDHEDWRMDKVDEVEHEDKEKAKDKARAKEGEWILKYDCVNMIVSGRTHREYRETHAEFYAEYNKQYNKKYREQNNAEIKAKKAEKVTCEVCNAVVSNCHMARHRKTKKHINAINPDINTNQ